MADFSRLLPYLSRRVLITAHRNPDGDAIGSCLAMYGVVEFMGGSAHIYSQDPYDPEFEYLEDFPLVSNEAGDIASYDMVLVCDTGSIELLGEAVKPLFADASHIISPRPFTVALDHHRTRDPFCDFEIVDDSASAVGVLIGDLMRAGKIPMSRKIGKALWCSIFTDTGGFRYGSTDARTLALGESLLEAGVDAWEAAQAIYESNPLGRIKLLGMALSSLEVRFDGRVAGLCLDREAVLKSGYPLSLSSGFVNYGRSIKGVEMAFFIRPSIEPADLYRVSFRSRGTYPVDEIAARLGGGGHRNASGCRVTAPSVQDAMEQVFSTVSR
ncbi:DHH family phosphoesterase, partial [Myxococcota bacterium]|nr:DHH family phosphoesterase [Myxococcota bacterium]